MPLLSSRPSLNFSRVIFAVLVALTLTACATYPMGLTKSEWEVLPPEKQAELRAEHYRIQAEERARREEAARQRAAEAAAAAREREARLAELRANARYGDIVVVTLQGGAFRWDNRHYPLQPIAFELIKGEQRRIELIGHHGNRSYRDDWWVSFSEDGHTVVLNDTRFDSRLVLVDNGGWEKGHPVALTSLGPTQIDRLSLHGMLATIRYKPLPGMPQRVIIEQR